MLFLVVMGLTLHGHQSTGWHFDDVAQVGRTVLDGRNTDAPSVWCNELNRRSSI